MDYSQLSDFEINKRVGIALGKGLMPDDCQDFGLSGFPDVMLRNGDMKDYCNNPADAYPLIYKNGISIGIYGYGEWGAGTTNHTYTDGVNPLRAAMIVFLMMQANS